jgi:tetratricopeptide (TPR) repeat protein
VECDVYQLGLLAFLLLTGQRAFHQHEREPMGLLHAMRNGAPLPSGIKSGSGPIPTSSTSWARQLKGDLDAVILRALQFDSSERYPGAREFADDLQNWLDHLPVSARSHGAWYRSRRYLRRHWLGASAIALIFLLVAGYAVTLTWQSKRLAEQRNTAEAAQFRAESIRDFLLQVFGSVDPQSQVSRGKTIEQLLIEGVERARLEYADQPLLAAQLLMDMGDVLSRRGRLPEARQAFEDAGRMRAAALGENDPETLAVAIPLGQVLYQQGEGQAALDLLHRHLAETEQVFGAQSDAVIDALAALAPVESVYGDIASAEAQLQRASELQTGLYPDSLPAPEQPLRQALILNQLGVVLMRARRYAEAAPFLEQSLERYEQHAGRLDYRTLEVRKNLAYLYRMMKLPDQALELFEQTLQDERELYDGAHWQIAYTLGHLANMASDAKDYEKAIGLWEEAEAETRAAMGDDYYWLDSARIGRARSLMLLGRQDEGRLILSKIAESPNAQPATAQLARDLLARFAAE